MLARVAARGVLPAFFRAVALATPPLSVQRYSLEEGLSQQAVNAIAQDSEGFMWFGTEDGLNRFDGYEFRQLRHDRGDDAVVAERLDLRRWSRAKTVCGSRTDGGGVVFRNAQTGKLEAPAALRDAPDLQRVRALARDRLGRLWIASRDAGVAIFDPRTQELRRIRHSPTEAALALRQFHLQHRPSAQRRHAGRHRDAVSIACPRRISTSRASRCPPNSRPRASRCACAR